MPHRVPPTRQQIIAQVIVSVVILVSGVVIGSGGTILALRDRIIPPTTTPVAEPNDAQDRKVEGPATEIVAKWTADYGLTETQAQQARDTLTSQFTAVHSLWRKFQEAEQAEREKLAVAMKGILTADQFTRWDADFKRMVDHMQRMRPFDPRRGGRGGPGGRGEWPPDRRMDPNDRRGGWRPGPPGDPNGMRGDWPRDGFKGPGGRRGDWGRDRPRDPNDQRERRPPQLPMMDPNGPPPGMPPEPR
jgi:hypothetical protein